MQKWINKDGESIKIVDMSDQHIINSIKWLVNDPSFGQLFKNDKADFEWVLLLTKELGKRKKKAFQLEFDAYLNDIGD
jgi:hypothetical protein